MKCPAQKEIHVYKKTFDIYKTPLKAPYHINYIAGIELEMYDYPRTGNMIYATITLNVLSVQIRYQERTCTYGTYTVSF